MTNEEITRYEKRLLELEAEIQAIKDELNAIPDSRTIPFGPKLEEWVTKVEAATEVANRRFVVIIAEIGRIKEEIRCSSKT